MRSYDPKDKNDREDAERIKAEPWMLRLLKANPSYVYWGPHEDYMWKKEGVGGWDAPVFFETWKEFKWELDDLNECVNFYFHAERDSKDCPDCGATGYHPDALWVSESFYRHTSPFTLPTEQEDMAKAVMRGFGSKMDDALPRGSCPSEELLAKYGKAFREFCEEMRVHGEWKDRLTQDEIQVLWDKGRIGKYDGFEKCPTVEEMRGFDKKGIGHDAINRSYLVEARLKRIGIPRTCPKCEGHAWRTPFRRSSQTGLPSTRTALALTLACLARTSESMSAFLSLLASSYSLPRPQISICLLVSASRSSLERDSHALKALPS
jgi:hypothetical protein